MIFTEHFSKDQRLSAHKPCTCFWETCSSNRFSTGVCPWKLSRFFAVLRYVWYMKFVLITESPNQSSSRNEDGTFFPAKNCPSQGIENSRFWFLGQRFLKWAPLVGVRIPGAFAEREVQEVLLRTPCSRSRSKSAEGAGEGRGRHREAPISTPVFLIVVGWRSQGSRAISGGDFRQCSKRVIHLFWEKFALRDHTRSRSQKHTQAWNLIFSNSFPGLAQRAAVKGKW